MLDEFADLLAGSKETLNTTLSNAADYIPQVVFAILTLIIFYFIARWVRNGVSKLISKTFAVNANLKKLFESVTFLVVMTCGLFAALGILELNKTVTSLLAGAGILGLAISLAFQETLVNVIAGVGIAIREPILPGDLINIDGNEGWVRGTRMRTTTIRSYQGQDVIIPNKKLYNDVVINFTSSNERRVDIDFGVSYGDDLNKVVEIATEALERVSFAEKDRVDVVCMEFGDSSVNLLGRFWITGEDINSYLEARSEAIINLRTSFAENGITIPFPIRTLDFGIKGGDALSSQTLQVAQLDQPQDQNDNSKSSNARSNNGQIDSSNSNGPSNGHTNSKSRAQHANQDSEGE